MPERSHRKPKQPPLLPTPTTATPLQLGRSCPLIGREAGRRGVVSPCGISELRPADHLGAARHGGSDVPSHDQGDIPRAAGGRPRHVDVQRLLLLRGPLAPGGACVLSSVSSAGCWGCGRLTTVGDNFGAFLVQACSREQRVGRVLGVHPVGFCCDRVHLGGVLFLVQTTNVFIALKPRR